MSAMSPAEALRAMAERLQRRLEIVQGIEELIKSDPTLAEELRVALAANNGAIRRRPGGKLTHYDRIVQHFEANGNAWATVDEVANSIGVKRGAVAFTFYKAHRDSFEKQNHPDKGRVKQWRYMKGGDEE